MSLFTKLFTVSAAAVVLTVGPLAREQQPQNDPFAFVAPWIVLAEADRDRLDRDQVLTRTLPGRDGQIAVFVATRLNATPDALVAWTRSIAELKRSKFVSAAGRFADPPRLSDLDALSLDQHDLDAIRRCRVGNCGLKLSAAEIESLSAAVAHAGTDWREASQREFRRLVVDRVMRYRSGGIASLPLPADRRNARSHGEVLAAVVEQSPYLTRLPQVLSWLNDYPQADSSVESFFYWSKEHYGQGRPVISVTHVGIIRRESDHRLPAIIVVGKQIFATHYIEAGLGLMMVVTDATTGAPYLAYINRSQIDTLRGFFGRFLRGVFEDGVRTQAPQIIRGLRTRLESGAPP